MLDSKSQCIAANFQFLRGPRRSRYALVERDESYGLRLYVNENEFRTTVVTTARHDICVISATPHIPFSRRIGYPLEVHRVGERIVFARVGSSCDFAQERLSF